MLSQGGLQKLMKMSWVTLDRICEEERISDTTIRRLFEHSNRPLRSGAAQLSDEDLLEKLRGFGFDLDRPGLAQLCEGALSAEEVARPLMDRCDFRTDRGEWRATGSGSAWSRLWQRWWPDKVCLELLDDKVQAGYHELERNGDRGAPPPGSLHGRTCCACATPRAFTRSAKFDDRFPMTQSLFNWSQDSRTHSGTRGSGSRVSAGQDRGVRGRAAEVPRRGSADDRESATRGG